MLSTHPLPSHALVIDTGEISACIDACTDCEQACFSWADECLGASRSESLRRDLTCADSCGTTARLVTSLLETELQPASALEIARAQLARCARACATCERDCRQREGQSSQSVACAEACLRCEEACRVASSALTAGPRASASTELNFDLNG